MNKSPDVQNCQSKTRKAYALYAGYATVVTVAVLIIAKAYAYYVSGSASVLSSLIDSVLDSIVSITALFSVYYASRPADEDHRWGHGKMEAISALFQSAVIFGGGVFLVFETAQRLLSPEAVTHHMIGVYVMILSIIISGVLVMFQRYALRKSGSLAMEADSAHYSGDIVIHLGVLCVLMAGYYGAPIWIDPLFALGVAGYLAYLARKIAMTAVNMLLDRELPDEQRKEIVGVIEAHTEVLGWHDLRTHKNGSTQNGSGYVMSFDIEVGCDLTLWAAHEIAKDLEVGILKIFPDSEIMIHVDPQGYTEDARHRVKGVHH